MITNDLARACEALTSKRLFYPSAGRDFMLPVEAFHRYINEFWFVDINYRMDAALLTDARFEKLKTRFFNKSGTTIFSQSKFTIQIRRDTYACRASGRQFSVHKCRGRGYNLFRAAFRIPNEKLSIFFYRGDSSGEGGSGFYWLRRPTLKYVIGQLEPSAIVVSDGSNASEHFKPFRNAPEAYEDRQYTQTEFSLYSRTARCLDNLGLRYGPTLAWHFTAG